jgi:DNA topoisomerase-2
LCTDIKASFLLTFKRERLDSLITGDDDEEFVKKFKLCDKNICSMTNMHAYDRDEKIKKYGDFESILREFYEVRLEYYHRRKSYLEGRLKHEWDMNIAKVRFLEEVQSGEIVIYNRKTVDVIVDLVERGYPQFKQGKFSVGDVGDAAEEADDDEAATGSFNYLLNMPLRSITTEKLEKLRIARDLKEAEYNTLVNTTSQQIWLKDLDALEMEYARFMTAYEESRMKLEEVDGTGKKKTTVKGKKPVKRL